MSYDQIMVSESLIRSTLYTKSLCSIVWW